MAWQFQDIKYGWRIGIAAVLMGGITIFTAVNVQNRITQRDAIQVILGTVERCYATQLTTNPTYSVSPPSFVRNWYSNDYVGTNAILYTNIFTNVISERLDHAMMIDLDAKIVALCPYYVDTNSVYDGTTNIVMLSFTGLLTSLNLGDHTNFTSIPTIGTNAATFGPWAWRNYIVAWQERYKVLNALKVTARSISLSSATGKSLSVNSASGRTNYAVMVAYFTSNWPSASGGVAGRIGSRIIGGETYPNIMGMDAWNEYAPFANITGLDTNISKTISYYVIGGQPYSTDHFIFDANGVAIGTNWTFYTSINAGYNSSNSSPVIFGNTNLDMPVLAGPPDIDLEWGEDQLRGFKLTDAKSIFDWQFNYCAVKYW